MIHSGHRRRASDDSPVWFLAVEHHGHRGGRPCALQRLAGSEQICVQTCVQKYV